MWNAHVASEATRYWEAPCSGGRAFADPLVAADGPAWVR